MKTAEEKIENGKLKYVRIRKMLEKKLLKLLEIENRNISRMKEKSIEKKRIEKKN